MCQDLLMFYSVNQRCYLTQVPYVISITLMIPKITKDFFSLHGLYEWYLKMCDICVPSPLGLLFPSPILSSLFHPPSPLLKPMHPCYACSCFICALDYSSIDSHADVATGRCADLALDTHN